MSPQPREVPSSRAGENSLTAILFGQTIKGSGEEEYRNPEWMERGLPEVMELGSERTAGRPVA
jgi:hypothetical protein